MFSDFSLLLFGILFFEIDKTSVNILSCMLCKILLRYTLSNNLHECNDLPHQDSLESFMEFV